MAPPLPRALVLGAHRHGGLSMLPQLSSRVEVVGISGDFTAKPFPAQQLAVTLRAFHPPIQVLTLGGAFDDEAAAAAEGVWRAYRDEVAADEKAYGTQPSGVKSGLVRTKGSDITKVKGEEGIEGYDAVVHAILNNIDRVLR